MENLKFGRKKLLQSILTSKTGVVGCVPVFRISIEKCMGFSMEKLTFLHFAQNRPTFFLNYVNYIIKIYPWMCRTTCYLRIRRDNQTLSNFVQLFLKGIKKRLLQKIDLIDPD